MHLTAKRVLGFEVNSSRAEGTHTTLLSSAMEASRAFWAIVYKWFRSIGLCRMSRCVVSDLGLLCCIGLFKCWLAILTICPHHSCDTFIEAYGREERTELYAWSETHCNDKTFLEICDINIIVALIGTIMDMNKAKAMCILYTEAKQCHHRLTRSPQTHRLSLSHAQNLHSHRTLPSASNLAPIRPSSTPSL